MKRLNYILIALFVLVGASCEKDEIPFFTASRFIYFPEINGGDSLSYSFLYSQGSDRYEMAIPVKFTGAMLDENVNYKLELVADKTTASEEEYDVRFEQPFRAGLYQDTLRLVLMDSERLKNQSVDLTLRLISNEYFEASLRDSLEIKITYTHRIGKPAWWNSEVTNSYLGEYSVTKLTEFVDHVYAGDYGALDSSEKLYYARKFKYHLGALEEPLYDENGLVTVPVIG